MSSERMEDLRARIEEVRNPKYLRKMTDFWNNRLLAVPYVDPTETTYTATLRFKNGTEVEIPEPGEGWIRGETRVYDWPKVFINSIKNTLHGVHLNTTITHSDGRIVWDEYTRRIEAEQAQILEVTKWSKTK